jgi:DNA (cytosine-5)-methyltransferase 1
MSCAGGNVVLSLFSGAGGLDLGFRWAGYDVRLAIDKDEAATKTYERNHPSAATHSRDLSHTRASEIARLWTEACPESAPVGVIGGPPCQAFSRGNARPSEDDERRDLPVRYAKLLKGLNREFSLDFFVFENVVGLLSPRHSHYYAQLLEAFEEGGFRPWPVVLDALRFGVPQRRKRLFVVGLNRRKFRSGHPEPPGDNADVAIVTVRQAIGSLPEPVYFAPALAPHLIPYHPNHWTMVPRSPKFDNGLLSGRHMNGRSFRVLRWDEPSWTICFGHREVHVHPSGDRRLSVFEAMLLQGFPRDYELVGTLSDQIRLVSDAVPPPLAFAVARTIRRYLSGGSEG